MGPYLIPISPTIYSFPLQSFPVAYANVKPAVTKRSTHSAFTLAGKVLMEAFRNILWLKILIFGSKNNIPVLFEPRL